MVQSLKNAKTRVEKWVNRIGIIVSFSGRLNEHKDTEAATGRGLWCQLDQNGTRVLEIFPTSLDKEHPCWEEFTDVVM